MTDNTENQPGTAAPAAIQLHDAMIDIESLGTKPGSAILSIGAVMFGTAGLGAQFYAPVRLSSCTAVGLTIDADTVAWWMGRSDAARVAAFDPAAAPLTDVLLNFSAWFTEQDAEQPWCHGATFDIPLLDAAYEACKLVPPWKYWDVRDTRTLYDLAGVRVCRSVGTHHNALHDAIDQARAAVQALRILRARADASTLTPELLDEISEAFRLEADADPLLARGGLERLTAFDYFKRGWLGNGVAVNKVLQAPGATEGGSLA